jgi:hypothetical protein
MTQPASPDHAGTETPVSGYGLALKTGFQETTRRVQDMHRAIADLSFRALRWIPGMAGPARLTRDAHDLIADGIYAAIRETGGGLLAVAALLERRAAANAPAETAPPGRLATGLRSALNAAVGDHLAASANPLAIAMGFRAAGQPVPLTTDGLRAHLPDPTDRLCLFIHGLGCDEHCWQLYSETAWDPPGQHYGPLLRAELGYTPLYLRYNTGLPIADNGNELARQIQLLLAAYPQPVRELVLIGHSMGGLVARGACQHAAAEALPWLKLTRMVRFPLILCKARPWTDSAASCIASYSVGWPWMVRARSSLLALNSIASTASCTSSDANGPMMWQPSRVSVSAWASILTMPDGRFHRLGATVGAERESADLVGDALGLQRLLGLADPGDFRAGVDHPRNGVVIQMTVLAGDDLGHHDAFLGTLVRQHRPAHHVANRVHPRQVGPRTAHPHGCSRARRTADRIRARRRCRYWAADRPRPAVSRP